MGPGGVVVIDELDEDALEVAFVSDEEPVQTLGPHSANESFGERVRARCAHWRLYDSGAYRSQHLVEGTNELRVAIADQELVAAMLVLETRCEIARLLGDPSPDRTLGSRGGDQPAPVRVSPVARKVD